MPRQRSRSRSSELKNRQRGTRHRDSSVSNRRSPSSESPGPSAQRRSSRDYTRTKHVMQRTGGEGTDLANAGAHMQRAQTSNLRAGEAGKRESIVHVNPETSHKAEGHNAKAAVEGTQSAADNPGDFSNFPEISSRSVELLRKREITSLFPVQYMSFRRIWNKEDLIVRDLTGSGKTLGFCLPMIESLRKDRAFGQGKPLAMILAPTRELALQITKELNALKHSEREYNVLTVYGGVPIDDQTYQLRRGVDIFVGTTGRVKDHMERKNFDFSGLRYAILDEADRMLNLGFKEEVEEIMGTIKQHGPPNIQCLMFSATVPRWIQNIATCFLKPNYSYLDLVGNLKNKTSKGVQHLIINCPYHNRITALADILICYGTGQTIVFTPTKNEANQLLLSDKIKNKIEVMHGDIAQNQREVTLKRFKDLKFQVLVATDVASRGLDIPSVDLVVQVEPPQDPETYIHRAGRTARAGRNGTCITFYTHKQVGLIQQIQAKVGAEFQKIGVPQPEQVIKASSRDIVKSLEEVNDKVLPLFEDAADELIAAENGDFKKALCKTLALLSGHHKEMMIARSMLNGQENMVTYQITCEKPFYAISFIWNLIRKYCPDSISTQVKGMRAFKDMTGAVFDVPEHLSNRVEDIFFHETEERRNDFKFARATELPELKEDENRYGPPQMGGGGYGGGYQRGGYGGGYGGRGGYQGNRDYSQGYGGHQGGYQGRGGYQGNSYGGGGYGQQQQNGYDGAPRMALRSSDQPQRSSGENSVFVGNLGEADQQTIAGMFQNYGVKPMRIRILVDDQTGRSKGAAFVDFGSAQEAQQACTLDGREGIQGRRLRVNPANSKPGTR